MRRAAHIRDGRLEDASTAIADAQSLGVADASEINALEEELRAAHSDRRVDEVLTLANQRLDDGSLTSPANDNARYYFQLALSNDPNNAAAQTGLTVVASKIVLQAREEIDGGRFNTAEALLAEARQLDPASDELATSTKALNDTRQRVEDDRRRVEADQQAAAEREAADRRAEEELQAAATRAEEQRLENERLAAEVAAAAAVAAAVTQAAAETPDAGGSGPDSNSVAEEEPAAGDAGEPIATAEPVTTAEPAKEEAAQPVPVPVRERQPIAVSSLTRGQGKRSTKRLSLQQLETRKLMAADIGLADGVLSLQGTEMDDVAEVYSESGEIAVRLTSYDNQGQLTGELNETFAADDVQRVVFVGGEGNDVLVNDSSVPTIARSGAGADVLMGGDGDDLIAAGTGDDIVLGGGGDDLILGGPGANLDR